MDRFPSNLAGRIDAYDAVRAWGVDDPAWVYCSPSDGDDARDGLSRAGAVKTCPRAHAVAMASGRKRILVDGGIDVGHGVRCQLGGLNGTSTSAPGGWFSTLGRGRATVRRLDLGEGEHDSGVVQSYQAGLANVALCGLDVVAAQVHSAGEFRRALSLSAWYDRFDGFLVESCRFVGATCAIMWSPSPWSGRSSHRGVTLRRCQVEDLAAFGRGVGEHRVGFALGGAGGAAIMDDLALIDCGHVNGWALDEPWSNHSGYIIGARGAVVRGFFSDGSGGYGLKIRASTADIADVVHARGNLGLELVADDAVAAATLSSWGVSRVARMVTAEPTVRVHQVETDAALGDSPLGWGVEINGMGGQVEVSQILAANGGPVPQWHGGCQQGIAVLVRNGRGHVSLDRVMDHHYGREGDERQGTLGPAVQVERPCAGSGLELGRMRMHSAHRRVVPVLILRDGVPRPLLSSRGGVYGLGLDWKGPVLRDQNIDPASLGGAGRDYDLDAWDALTGETPGRVVAPAETNVLGLIAARMGYGSFDALSEAYRGRDLNDRQPMALSAKAMAAIALEDAGLLTEPEPPPTALERSSAVRRWSIGKPTLAHVPASEAAF